MLFFKNAEKIENVPIEDRAFQYGDGCFTTARLRNNQIELQDLHWARLRNSCERLYLDADFDLIDKALEQLQNHYPVLNGTLKILISRGTGQRGYSLPEHPADIYILFYPKASEVIRPQLIRSGVLNQAMGLCMPSLVGIKSLNRLEQVLLKKEAEMQGWDEALVTDVQGSVVEGVSSNCFVFQNNTWFTPELRYNGVHGVMRATILSRMQRENIVCEQRFIDMENIGHFQSLFFCNALSPMKIVTQLGQRSLDSQPCLDLFRILQLDQIS